MTKSRKVTWAADVLRMEDMITEYEILFGKAEGKKPLGRCVYRNMILKCILKRGGVERFGLDLSGSGWGPAVCKHRNELLTLPRGFS